MYSVLLDRKCPQQWVCDLCEFASLWAVVMVIMGGRNVRKSGQLGKIMRPAQKTSRFARLYDQHDHNPQRSEFTQVAYPLLRAFTVE